MLWPLVHWLAVTALALGCGAAAASAAITALLYGVLHRPSYSPCRPLTRVEWRPLEDATGRPVRDTVRLPRGYRYGAGGRVYYRFTYSVSC